MKLLRILTAAIVAVTTVATFSLSAANAAGTYKISCKNQAYGMHLGSDYTQIAYVYNTALRGDAYGAGDPSGRLNGGGLQLQYLIGGEYGEAYVGNDCLYAGSSNTNGTTVVSGDVARLAINAIVGAVSNRIDQAYASREASSSVTGLSFTTQSDGVSMSANKLVGGLSLWADYGNSDFKNTQAYTNVRLNSMKYDGSASSYSVGVDKQIGNVLVGLVISNLDTDLNTTFNTGTYKQQVDTYGVYLAYRTSILQIDLGTGTGESDISTTRIDLGNDSTISGSTTADIEYSNAKISATFTRGRFSIVPSASYETMSMDIAAFTDDRQDDISGDVVGEGLLFGTHSITLAVQDDSIAARSVETTSMDFGVTLSANLGKIMPFIKLSYENEDTTRGTYNTEFGTDETNETLASDYSSASHVGGGINFNLGSHISGGVRVGTYSGRDDWQEDYFAGSLRVGF
jgi:hypothetical protein